MNDQTQQVCIIVFSSVLFGSVGGWLTEGKPKGAIAGTVVGAAASMAYTRQDKRLKQLGLAQAQLSQKQGHLERQHRSFSTRFSTFEQMLQQGQNTEIFERMAESYDARIRKLEGSGSPNGQATLNQKELNRLRLKVESLQQTVQNQTVPPIIELEQRLGTLENTLNTSGYANGLKLSDHESLNGAITEDGSALESEDGAEHDVNQEAIAWLESKQVDVESCYEPDPIVDGLLDELSLYLGEHYAVLKRFHRKLRSNVGRKLYFDLKGLDSREKSIHNQYLKRLKSSDFLRFGRVVKSTERSDYIVATTHERSDVQGFLDGGWFERFIYSKSITLFESEGVDYRYLRNSKITYKHGQSDKGKAELDLFFLLDGKPLLIECKAGSQYDEKIEKFVTNKKMLGIDSNNAILVVLDIDQAEAHLRSKNWNITVSDQNTFIDSIRELILAEENTPPSVDLNHEQEDIDETKQEESAADASADASTEITHDTLASFFRDRRLNVAPESRAVVFAELLQVMSSLEGSITFNELTKVMRDRMKNSSALARNKISEILNCLRYSDLFINHKRKPVRSVHKPISAIRSTDSEEFETVCMAFYAKTILTLFDPDFFETKESIQEFETLTHGKAPSQARIRELSQAS